VCVIFVLLLFLFFLFVLFFCVILVALARFRGLVGRGKLAENRQHSVFWLDHTLLYETFELFLEDLTKAFCGLEDAGRGSVV
ncbi:hypothetical protein, partial [Staphylococcus aureus]